MLCRFAAHQTSVQHLDKAYIIGKTARSLVDLSSTRFPQHPRAYFISQSGRSFNEEGDFSRACTAIRVFFKVVPLNAPFEKVKYS